MKKIALTAILLGTAISSQALDGPYMGFGYNIDNLDYKDPSYDITEPAASSLNITAGYNFNRYIGIEIRTLIGLTGTESKNFKKYCDQSQQPSTGNVDAPDERVDCPNNEVSEARLNSMASLNLKLGAPLGEYTTLLAKAGYSYADYAVEKFVFDSDLTASDEPVRGLGEKGNVYGESIFYGVGLGFEMKSGNQFELMYNINYDDDLIEHSSVNLSYNHSF